MAKRKPLDPRTLPPNPNGWRVLPGNVDLRDPHALDEFMPPGSAERLRFERKPTKPKEGRDG